MPPGRIPHMYGLIEDLQTRERYRRRRPRGNDVLRAKDIEPVGTAKDQKTISCRQTGPLVIGDIKADEAGEEVFSERASLVFKSIAVRRIYDKKNDTLIYVAYSRQVQDASAKMSVTTVPLGPANATWANGKPGP